MVGIIIDTATGLEIRYRKAGGKSRAYSVGPVAFSPVISVSYLPICTGIFIFTAGLVLGVSIAFTGFFNWIDAFGWR